MDAYLCEGGRGVWRRKPARLDAGTSTEPTMNAVTSGAGATMLRAQSAWATATTASRSQVRPGDHTPSAVSGATSWQEGEAAAVAFGVQTARQTTLTVGVTASINTSRRLERRVIGANHVRRTTPANASSRYPARFGPTPRLAVLQWLNFPEEVRTFPRAAQLVPMAARST